MLTWQSKLHRRTRIFDRARVKNYERAEELATRGHRFRNFLEQEGCWYWEVFEFLKDRAALSL